MSAENLTIDCGSNLTVATAADMHQKLQDALNGSSTINLKADEVEKVDTAGLQLFVALNKELDKSGGKLVWQTPSETLLQASNTLGLTHSVGLGS